MPSLHWIYERRPRPPLVGEIIHRRGQQSAADTVVDQGEHRHPELVPAARRRAGPVREALASSHNQLIVRFNEQISRIDMTNEDLVAAPRNHPAVQPAVEIRNLSKSFPGTLALAAFDLQIDPGEVHVLVGANGSGKSTLIKVLSGFHVPDPGGDVEIGGVSLPFGAGEHSYRLGCRFVHQDLGLVDSLSVLDNLHLGSFPTRYGTIRGREMKRSSIQMLAQVGLDLDPNTLVADLGASQRTGVALARAVRADEAFPPRLLVLDEPTATLPADEVDHLLTMVRVAAARGV